MGAGASAAPGEIAAVHAFLDRMPDVWLWGPTNTQRYQKAVVASASLRALTNSRDNKVELQLALTTLRALLTPGDTSKLEALLVTDNNKQHGVSTLSFDSLLREAVGAHYERFPKEAAVEVARLKTAAERKFTAAKKPSQQAEQMWSKKAGGELEPFLKSGAVALLCAEWVVQTWEQSRARCEPFRMPRRQDLPPDAFVSLDELKNESCFTPVPVNVVCLSYAWLSPSHPDPKGSTFSTMASILQQFVQEKQQRHAFLGKKRAFRIGVFWDFASLHQHDWSAQPPVMRTPQENALFKQGLEGMTTFYTHSQTMVLRMTTRSDSNWPNGYDLGQGNPNVNEYPMRGWCFTETCFSSLTKPPKLNIDLSIWLKPDVQKLRLIDIISRCTKNHARVAPFPPSEPVRMGAELAARSFTNGKDDRPLVQMLYTNAFNQRMTGATTISFTALGFDDVSIARVARILGGGLIPGLQKLDVSWNNFTDQGAKELVGALASGAVPKFMELKMDTCRNTSDVTLLAFADAIGKGALPCLHYLKIDSSNAKNRSEGAKNKLREACKQHQRATCNSTNLRWKEWGFQLQVTCPPKGKLESLCAIELDSD